MKRPPRPRPRPIIPAGSQNYRVVDDVDLNDPGVSRLKKSPFSMGADIRNPMNVPVAGSPQPSSGTQGKVNNLGQPMKGQTLNMTMIDDMSPGLKGAAARYPAGKPTDEPPPCFGLFVPRVNACGRCAVAQKCQAIMKTDGLDIIASILDEVEANLPDQPYPDGDSVRVIVDLILEPARYVGQPQPGTGPTNAGDDPLNLLD